MARNEKYYSPVKNLLAVEEQEYMINTWREKNLQQYWSNFTQTLIEKAIDTTNNPYIDYLKQFGIDPNKRDLKEMWDTYNNESLSSPFIFYNKMNSPETFEAIGNELIDEIRERYNADEVCFIYGRDVTRPYHIHKDPDYVRSCNINIPLFPDYDKYRSTYYYDSDDESSKVCEVDYAKIKSPVLLNNKKFHNCGGSSKYTGDSLAIQFGYYRKYVDVRKELGGRQLLTTTR